MISELMTEPPLKQNPQRVTNGFSELSLGALSDFWFY
jgi:hypothetical protein